MVMRVAVCCSVLLCAVAWGDGFAFGKMREAVRETDQVAGEGASARFTVGKRVFRFDGTAIVVEK